MASLVSTRPILAELAGGAERRGSSVHSYYHNHCCRTRAGSYQRSECRRPGPSPVLLPARRRRWLRWSAPAGSLRWTDPLSTRTAEQLGPEGSHPAKGPSRPSLKAPWLHVNAVEPQTAAHHPCVEPSVCLLCPPENQLRIR